MDSVVFEYGAGIGVAVIVLREAAGIIRIVLGRTPENGRSVAGHVHDMYLWYKDDREANRRCFDEIAKVLEKLHTATVDQTREFTNAIEKHNEKAEKLAETVNGRMAERLSREIERRFQPPDGGG